MAQLCAARRPDSCVHLLWATKLPSDDRQSATQCAAPTASVLEGIASVDPIDLLRDLDRIVDLDAEALQSLPFSQTS
jgi:hypothetical protein